jgi:hypothetical protein
VADILWLWFEVYFDIARNWKYSVEVPKSSLPSIGREMFILRGRTEIGGRKIKGFLVN